MTRAAEVGVTTDKTRHRITTRHGRWRRWLTLVFLEALLCVVAAEVAARAYWRLLGVPFGDPGQILYAYYPALRDIDAARPAHDDQFYDILLLGASTLHKDWGQVEQSLREQLAYAGHRNVRIFNLAMPALTSRDGWLQYAAVGEARFELVVFYHGINDARANNAPPEIFRDDYSHYSWYEVVNTLAAYHGTARLALPYTLRYLGLRTRQFLMKDRYVPKHLPRPDWVLYGNTRSAAAFTHNLSAILDLAAQRSDRVLLMTFATYVPANYSLEAFMEKRLDYGLHLTPIEILGQPDVVVATVASQNEVIRRLAGEHPGVLFVDQARLMAGTPIYFNDPCHFTVAGSVKFVENLLPTLLLSFDGG